MSAREALPALPGPIRMDVEDDREKLRKENARLTRENEDLKLENQKLELEARRMQAGVVNLQKWLGPLHASLGLIWGEFDAMDLPPTDGAGPTVSNSRLNPRFAAALSRLGEGQARVLKLIMDVGPMSVAGIATSLKMSTRTIYNITPQLAQMGLAKIIDGKLRLTED